MGVPVVDRDATPLEVAALMARMHSPMVAVVDGDGAAGIGRVVGAITASLLLDHLLPARPAQS
jgi:CBS domain-containing protein